MAEEDEDRIRERAYRIWQESGRPERLDRHHWELAKAELQSEESKGGQGRKKPAAAKTTRRAGGLASGLQPGGETPADTPGAVQSGVGTGGAATQGASSGTVKRSRGSSKA